jgi:hypothetical protein
MYISNYSSAGLGASTGQTPVHVPQEMQAASSITYLSPLAEIQATGQAPAHAPHPIHLSLILYAI